jgi:antitoxin component HigA of HigAB toxin-antitoxin module
MYRAVINVQTGEQETIPLTAEEIAEIEARPQPEPAPVLTTEQKLEAAGLTVAELKELLGLS